MRAAASPRRSRSRRVTAAAAVVAVGVAVPVSLATMPPAHAAVVRSARHPVRTEVLVEKFVRIPGTDRWKLVLNS